MPNNRFTPAQASTPSPIGPQYRRDNTFTARMRFHQSWYRANCLGVAWGTGPMPHSTRQLGNMLTREDGAAGRNFVSSEVFQLALDRIATKSGTVDEFRLLHNMLSSQPMCFNLFGFLGLDLDFATRLFAILEPDVARVTDVRIEWNPQPASDYLNDRTAFDAFVEYERVAGGMGFFGIETKLTERFSQKEYDSPAYRRWLVVPEAPWKDEAADELHRKAHNQLWRIHLLTVALRHRCAQYDVGAVVVVGHPGDEELGRTVDGYRELLTTQDSLRVWPLDRVVAVADACAVTPAQTEWVAAFGTRYLRLDLSGEEWRQHRMTGHGPRVT